MGAGVQSTNGTLGDAQSQRTRKPSLHQVPLATLSVGPLLLHAHLFICSIYHWRRSIFEAPPPIIKTNFFFKPVQVRTNQLVQKRKAQTCITDDMFGRKVEKWTFQRLGKEWVKRPRLASKREALSNRCSRCRAQSLVLLTFLEPWEMRAKVLNSIILHPSWSSVEDICLSLIL